MQGIVILSGPGCLQEHGLLHMSIVVKTADDGCSAAQSLASGDQRSVSIPRVSLELIPVTRTYRLS